MRDGRPVLDGPTLRLYAGAITLLVGPNGAGKTTLLRALAGVVPLSAGAVNVGGRDPRRDPQARASLALVPQEIALYPRLTVPGEPRNLRGLRGPTTNWRSRRGGDGADRVGGRGESTRRDALGRPATPRQHRRRPGRLAASAAARRAHRRPRRPGATGRPRGPARDRHEGRPRDPHDHARPRRRRGGGGRGCGSPARAAPGCGPSRGARDTGLPGPVATGGAAAGGSTGTMPWRPAFRPRSCTP